MWKGLMVLVMLMVGVQSAAAAEVRVHDAWVRASLGMAPATAGYLTLKGGSADDALVAVRTPAAGRTELHTMTAGENGIMMMRRVEAVPVPAGATVTLAPGGLHLMLMDLPEKLAAGDVIDLVMTFESGAEVKITAPVRGMGAMPH